MRQILDFTIGFMIGYIVTMFLYAAYLLIINYGLYVLAGILTVIGLKQIARLVHRFRGRALKVYPMPYRIAS